MTHVTCRLTAKNRDQLRNATLGNRVWAIFSSVGKYRCAIYIFFIKRDVYSEKNQVNRRKIVHQSCNPYSARVKKMTQDTAVVTFGPVVSEICSRTDRHIHTNTFITILRFPARKGENKDKNSKQDRCAEKTRE